MSLWADKPTCRRGRETVLGQMGYHFSWHYHGQTCGVHVQTARSAPGKLSSSFCKLSQKPINCYAKERKSTEESSYIVHSYHPLSRPEPLPDQSRKPIRQNADNWLYLRRRSLLIFRPCSFFHCIKRLLNSYPPFSQQFVFQVINRNS